MTAVYLLTSAPTDLDVRCKCKCMRNKHQQNIYSIHLAIPYMLKKAIRFSPALLLRRICSTDVTFSPRRLILQSEDVNKPKRIPFITTFNRITPTHISLTLSKCITICCSPSNRCKNVFQHLPVVVFRCSPNLCDLLVTA